ncbi:MAG TPA: four helix bundle protein [Bacteroidia bacterium]|nr:four helix bundle protein [Bacteroidia bacterium]
MSSQGYKDLIVYKNAYAAAMEIFNLSKKFPKEETYSLTDQVRRSSRSVCSNLAEAYRKRIYPKHFISKLSDSDGECAETLVHLDFAKDCGYLDPLKHKIIVDEYLQVGKMLGSMMNSPEKFQGSKLPTATANSKQ